MDVSADETDGMPEPDRESSDMKMLRDSTARLMEHFHTVHIFATRHISTDEGTTAAQYGEGNWYARRGQIGDWITKQDSDAAGGE
jgi:hypothetical protein